ncbi:MAG: hypothetical protein J7497_05040 [Chitinophagaceae bacterium]|nr:hypothetical protein [Chitinophagaceae bacterium]
MNKYLLLRDNKQSGPYTVDEIIAKGIKAYDLVWLEGKSAAWRYPSEIEELKAFAPTIEEQPFDRFYKKPEVTAENNSRFEPRPVVTETGTPIISPSKKVYINFPGTQPKIKREEPVITDIPRTEPVKTQEPETKFISENFAIINQPVSKKNNKQLLYAGIAACFVLVSCILYFAINYTNQKKDISQLSALVQKLEERAKNQNTIITPAVNTASVPELAEPVIQEPVESHKEAVVPIKKQAVRIKPAESAQPTTTAVQTIAQPVQKNNVATATASHENLFNLVSVKSNKYKTGVLGGISNLQLELTNNSLVPLQRVTVEIKYLGPEKRVVRTQTVHFENIAPGAESVLDVPKSNRGVTVDYVITDIRS